MRPTTQLIVFALLLMALPVSAADVPAQLPDPDGKPGDAARPVKVYILAGQSNMVGMGNLSGAKNVYTGVYLSSDPTVPSGPFQIYRVGNYKVSRLSVYLPDGKPTGNPIGEGLIEVPQHGVYQLHCGFSESSFSLGFCSNLNSRYACRSAASGSLTSTRPMNGLSTSAWFVISGLPRFCWRCQRPVSGSAKRCWNGCPRTT